MLGCGLTWASKQVIGAFTPIGHWLPLMVDSVAAPQASLTTRVNALVVLSSMLYAAGMLLSCTPLAYLTVVYCNNLGLMLQGLCGVLHATMNVTYSASLTHLLPKCCIRVCLRAVWGCA